MGTLAPHPDQTAAVDQPPAARRLFTITLTTRTMWIGALIILAIVLVVFLVIRAQAPIVLLALAIILGESIRPLVVRLKQYRIPGALAVLLIYVVVLLVVGLLLWLLLTPLLGELSTFVQHLPQYLTELQDDIHQLERSLRVQEPVNTALDALSESLATVLQNSIPTLLAVPFSALSWLFGLFIDIVIVLTMALFWLASSARLKQFVVGLFPAQSQEQASLVIGEAGRSLGSYVRGLLISMVLIGSIAGLGLTILGIPYALLLGVLTGFTALLPYIGPWVSGPIAVVVTLIAVDPAKAVQVVILFFLIFIVEGEIISPLVMSRMVRVDPLLVIMSVLIGLSLLGVIGAIVAVPIAATIQVLIVRVLAPAIRRSSGQSAQSSPAVAEQTPGTVGVAESP